MIRTFLSLNMLRLVGLGLGYVTIVYLNRSRGTAALGDYLFVLNSVIVVGTLACLGLPTVVQRLSAKLTGVQIGGGTRLVLSGRVPWMMIVALACSTAILTLDEDRALTASALAGLALTALAFAMTLILIETTRVVRGAEASELQRNVLRPALVLMFLMLGFETDVSVGLAVLCALALCVWRIRNSLFLSTSVDSATSSETEIADYVAERMRDMRAVFGLSAIGLVFGAMDVVLFGFLVDIAETGIYGAASRFGMLVNVALLAGNAQMVRHIARVASGEDPDSSSLAAMRRQVKLVRLTSTALVLTLTMTFPLYAWVVDIQAERLWPYFAIVAGSFWLQGLIGPTNIFLMQAHQVDRLIFYHSIGLVVFALVGGLLYALGTYLAVPAAAGAGVNTVKLLSWRYIRRSRNLLI